jgi:CRP/FNR family transcriptional regulator, cyclic AMP receptor protein
LRRLTGEASDLVFLDLPRRVAKMLLSEIDSRGSERVTLGLNQTEVGQRVEGTRQSVNTALRAFVRRGWITVDGNHIVIEDPPALRRFLTS